MKSWYSFAPGAPCNFDDTLPVWYERISGEDQKSHVVRDALCVRFGLNQAEQQDEFQGVVQARRSHLQPKALSCNCSEPPG